MKRLNTLLNEVKGEKAHKEAIAMGLKYKGFGYWVDSSGKTTHKTVGDVLQPVDLEQEAEKAEKVAGGNTGEVVPNMSTSAQMTQAGQMPGVRTAMGLPPVTPGSMVGGAPEPGKEQVPATLEWEPGPDGSTCVNSAEPPAAVPEDSYVGTPNNIKWIAGPQGSNFTNITFDQLKAVMEELVGVQEEEEKDYTGQRTMMDRVRGKIKLPSDGGETERRVQKALAPLKTKDREAELDHLSKAGAPDYGGDDRQRAQIANDAAYRVPSRVKDKQKVKEMNKTLQGSGFLSQPDFDLKGKGDYMASGAFGEVNMGKDGKSVIKEGDIGVDELKALAMLKDHDRFPTLLNAEFTEPFKHKSSERNNPGGAKRLKMGPNQSAYWNPDDKSDFDKRFPTARGVFAMSKAEGRPLFDWDGELDEDQDTDLADKIHRLRRDMHMAGLSHNDMHGGNILRDDDGNVSMLDLGLAKANPISALMEAMGGLGDQDEGDYQLSDHGWMDRIPQGLRDRIERNHGRLREHLLDQLNPEDDPSEVEDFLTGGIRQSDTQLDELRERFPFLQDEDGVRDLISMFYEGVDGYKPPNLKDRMSKAHGKLVDEIPEGDLDTWKRANNLMQMLGKPPIPWKGLDIESDD